MPTQTTTELNPDDRQYTRRTYRIELHNAGSFTVHADSLQDALDAIIDAWEETETENPGYFMSFEDWEEIGHVKAADDYISGGNHGRHTTFPYHEMNAVETDRR